MLAPGGGAGNTAAAMASLKAMVPLVHKVLLAVPVGSKEYKTVHRILGDLNDLFGKDAGAQPLVPAAIQQLALAAKGGGGPKPAAPGLGAAPPPGATPPENEAA